MNEIDIKIPVTKAMYGALASHIPAPALSEALLTGRRFSGPEALAAGVVDQIEPEDSVLPSAIARAAAMADKDRETMQIHKWHLFGQASQLCIAES
jgi:enoyl-CoA hydratase/carnithine racemase